MRQHLRDVVRSSLASVVRVVILCRLDETGDRSDVDDGSSPGVLSSNGSRVRFGWTVVALDQQREEGDGSKEESVYIGLEELVPTVKVFVLDRKSVV